MNQMIQHKAARFAFNDYHRHSTVSKMFNQNLLSTGEKMYCDHVLQDNQQYCLS